MKYTKQDKKRLLKQARWVPITDPIRGELWRHRSWPVNRRLVTLETAWKRHLTAMVKTILKEETNE